MGKASIIRALLVAAILFPAAPWAGAAINPEALKGRETLRVKPEDLPEPPSDFPAEEVSPPKGYKVFSDGYGFRVYFIDVGQGDAQYIELPNGQNALVDGGPSGKRLRAFLDKKGISTIDHVVLTHPHADHYAGLNYVFDEFEVNHFYDTKIDNTNAAGDDKLRDKARKERGCRTHYPAPGEALDWGSGVQVAVLNSCPDEVESSGGMQGGAEVNNCSIVLKLTSTGLSVLLTGDVQSEAEEAMVSMFGDWLESDLLKVGHHGSDESSSDDFIEAVQPATAVISVGKNGYDLPMPIVIDKLRELGARVYRTDTHGTMVAEDPAYGTLADRPEIADNVLACTQPAAPAAN